MLSTSRILAFLAFVTAVFFAEHSPSVLSLTARVGSIDKDKAVDKAKDGAGHELAKGAKNGLEAAGKAAGNAALEGGKNAAQAGYDYWMKLSITGKVIMLCCLVFGGMAAVWLTWKCCKSCIIAVAVLAVLAVGLWAVLAFAIKE